MPRIVAQPRSVPSYGIFASDQERRSFQFFLAETAPQLAGDFECASWERLLLQSVHHEPAIRHITVALGSLHENSGTSGTVGAHSFFALNQYLRAMRCLMPVSGVSQPLDVCLISCVLFTCFEAMRGHYGSATKHIIGGLKILGELRTNVSSTSSLSVGRTPYVPIDVLSGLFARLQAQAMVSVEEDAAAISNIWPELVIDLNQPIVFNSLADAREMLEIHTYYYRQRSTELRLQQQNQSKQTESLDVALAIRPGSGIVTANPSAITLRNISLSLLERWSTALDDFLRKRGDSLTDRERRGAAVLQLRKLDCFIPLAILRGADEGVETIGDHLRWDRYCPVFEQMVEQGESILKFSDAIPSFTKAQNFSLDLGIIGAMFNVASRCRDPVIRRRAVGVLRAASVQEGVWNSAVIARIAERWIAIEEEGLVVCTCADVPAAARLSQFLPVFDPDQPSALVYFSYSDEVDPGSVRMEVIYW